MYYLHVRYHQIRMHIHVSIFEVCSLRKSEKLWFFSWKHEPEKLIIFENHQTICRKKTLRLKKFFVKMSNEWEIGKICAIFIVRNGFHLLVCYIVIIKLFKMAHMQSTFMHTSYLYSMHTIRLDQMANSFKNFSFKTSVVMIKIFK